MNDLPQALTSSNLTFLRPSNNSPSPEYLLEELLFIHEGVSCSNGNKTKNSSHIEIDGSSSTQEPTSWDNQNNSKAEQWIVWVSNNHFSILYKQAPKVSIELYLWVV